MRYLGRDLTQSVHVLTVNYKISLKGIKMNEINEEMNHVHGSEYAALFLRSNQSPTKRSCRSRRAECRVHVEMGKAWDSPNGIKKPECGQMLPGFETIVIKTVRCPH